METLTRGTVCVWKHPDGKNDDVEIVDEPAHLLDLSVPTPAGVYPPTALQCAVKRLRNGLDARIDFARVDELTPTDIRDDPRGQ